MRRIQFALQRKTGYRSPYTLGMVYPSYRKGVHYQGAKGQWVAPIMVLLPFGPERWFRLWAPAVRFPSWIARKLNDSDADGFHKH